MSATVWKRRRKMSKTGAVRFGGAMVLTMYWWMGALQVPYGEVGERYVKKPCSLSIRACLYADENSKGLYDTGKN
jgi:hypothetical protein